MDQTFKVRNDQLILNLISKGPIIPKLYLNRILINSLNYYKWFIALLIYISIINKNQLYKTISVFHINLQELRIICHMAVQGDFWMNACISIFVTTCTPDVHSDSVHALFPLLKVAVNTDSEQYNQSLLQSV